MEAAGLGICQVTRGPSNLEKPVHLDNNVQRIAGLGKTTLREDDLVRDRSRSQPQLQPRGYYGLLAGRGARLDHVLIHQILKLRPPGFETVGVRVRNVV